MARRNSQSRLAADNAFARAVGQAPPSSAPTRARWRSAYRRIRLACLFAANAALVPVYVRLGLGAVPHRSPCAFSGRSRPTSPQRDPTWAKFGERRNTSSEKRPNRAGPRRCSVGDAERRPGSRDDVRSSETRGLVRAHLARATVIVLVHAAPCRHGQGPAVSCATGLARKHSSTLIKVAIGVEQHGIK